MPVRPVRLIRFTRPQPPPPSVIHNSTTAPRATSFRPVAIGNGQNFRVVSPPQAALVTPQLAAELTQVLEQFAQAQGFDQNRPLEVFFGRGTLGLHRFHRAVDIYGLGGKNLGQWVKEWNVAMRQVAATPEAPARANLVAEAKARNLGYKLYKALQAHGRWAQPQGFPVQLFGPWTRREGPHQAISDRLLYAHRDHIHVAK